MTTSGLRVALLVPEYRTSPAPGGGVANVADFFASSIERYRPNWTVHIVSPRMWHKSPESVRILDPHSWRRGVGVSEVTVKGRQVSYVGARWAEIESNRFRPRSRLDFLLEQADIVVGVAGTPAMFNMARRVSTPMVGQVATTSADERHRIRSTGSISRRVKAHFDSVIASGLDRAGIVVPQAVLVENLKMEAWSRAHSNRQIELIPPGVDLHAFRPRDSSPSDLKRPYILSVGRLADPRKNISLLIRAFSHAVHELGVKHDLVLAGNQEPPADALALARALGIQRNLRVLTSLTQQDLVRTYQGADLFAMSSSEEGLGLVQLEALACGVPVVTTRTAGAEFILRGSEAGILVDFGRGLDQRLGAAIATMLHSPGRRSAAARAALMVAKDFAADELGRKFIAVVEDTLSR